MHLGNFLYYDTVADAKKGHPVGRGAIIGGVQYIDIESTATGDDETTIDYGFVGRRLVKAGSQLNWLDAADGNFAAPSGVFDVQTALDANGRVIMRGEIVPGSSFISIDQYFLVVAEAHRPTRDQVIQVVLYNPGVGAGSLGEIIVATLSTNGQLLYKGTDSPKAFATAGQKFVFDTVSYNK